MDINKIKKYLITGIMTLSMPAAIYADTPGFYLGLEGGYTNTHNINQDVATTTGGVAVLTPSNKGVGGRAFMGFNINQYFGIEGGFTHYAPSTYTLPGGVILAAGNPVGHPVITENGFDLVGKGMWSFPYGFGIFGKAGVAIIRTSKAGTFTTSSTGTIATGTTNYVRPTAGLGLTYNLTQAWQTQFTVTRVFSGSGFQSADLIALGISYHFVDEYCGQFLC